MRKVQKSRNIPVPSVTRLCTLYSLLVDVEKKGIDSLSSADIGSMLGEAPHNIRKDISYLGEAGTSGAGYSIGKLKGLIEERLGLGRSRKACVFGLGILGYALINNKELLDGILNIVAGFDSNINRIETMVSSIPIHPAYEMSDVIGKMAIEIAIITETGPNSGVIVDRLVQGGIKGIVNLSSALIKPNTDRVIVRNLDFLGEFRLFSVLMNQQQ